MYNKIKNNASLQESFLHLTNDIIADNSSIPDDKSAHENGTFNEVQDTTSLLSPATPDNEVVVDDIVIENEILHKYLTNELSLDDELVSSNSLLEYYHVHAMRGLHALLRGFGPINSLPT